MRAISKMRGQSIVSVLALLTVLGVFSYVAVAGHVLENEEDYGQHEPDLFQVNSAVDRIGGRTVSYAMINTGAAGDVTEYADALPTISATRELGARYAEDGLATTGIYSRDAIRSIITTPLWARDYTEGIPDFNAIYRNAPGTKTAYRSPSGVLVSKVLNSDAMIVPTKNACLIGGPGLLDHLLAVGDLRETSLFTNGRNRCKNEIYANASPLDEMPYASGALTVTGADLCKQCTRVLDADYNYDPGRWLINNPWYRNAIDGDSPLIGRQGAVLLPNQAFISIAAPKEAGSYLLVVHLAAHGYSTIIARLPDGTTHTVRLLPMNGMRWITLPFTKSINELDNNIKLYITSDGFLPVNESYRWVGTALDGVVVFPSRLTHLINSESDGHVHAVAMSVDRFSPPTEGNFDEVTLPEAAFFGSASFANIKVDPSTGGTLSGPAGTASVTWNGPTEPVLVLAKATLPRRTDSLRIGTSIVQGGTKAPRGFVTIARTLRHGAVITARLSSDRTDHGVTLDDFSLVGLRGTVPFVDSGPNTRSGDISFTSSVATLADLSPNSRVTSAHFTATGLAGRRGDEIDTSLDVGPTPARVSVILSFGESTGKYATEIRCGRQSLNQIASSTDSFGIQIISNAPSCSLRVHWLTQGTLAHIFLSSQTSVWRIQERAWLPSGLSHVSLLSPELSQLDGSSIRVDGEPLDKAGRVRIIKTGVHTIELRNAPRQSYILLFVPISKQSPLERITVTPLAALRSEVVLSQRGDLKIAHLSDGNWVLSGSSGMIYGKGCDILATCFSDVPPGRYTVYHRWPWQLRMGLLLSALAWLAALAPLATQRRLLGATSNLPSAPLGADI